MDKALFNDLVQSLKEAKAIGKGKAKPARRTELQAPATNVKRVREQVGLTQAEFAQLIRVSVKTLQNWEQHRRSPSGPAEALLKIMGSAPEVALKSLHA